MAAKEIHTFQMSQGMRWQVTFSLLFFWLCHLVSGQLYYTIIEELRKSSVITNIAKDLELDIKALQPRKLSIVSPISEKYFALDLESGNLYVKDRIDREILCRTETTCFLTFDAVLENPLNVFPVTIEILDLNDNPPAFFLDTITLKISESTATGTFMALQNAEDPDIGTNSVQSYSLSANNHFTLRKKSSTDQNTFPVLVLEKPLDRETQEVYELLLKASDGGDPVQTGTAIIRVIVTDANDNLPIFTQSVYKVSISENTPINSTVLYVNATDKDEGTNAQITYSFIKTSENDIHAPMFSINPINVQATDGGGFVDHSKVLLEIIDENDNTPEITITSISSPIPEDSEPGTAIALIKVHDKDSGENGEVECQLLGSAPFQLVSTSSSYYRIITASALDREKVQWYNITILANDKGSPQLSSRKAIILDIADVNDNPPVFLKSTYVAYLPENNLPGASIYKIQASDMDSGENAKVIYSVFNKNTEAFPVSSYFSINIETGVLYAQRSFDYEQHKEFVMHVQAKDNGFPSLSSNATLIIRILDQNDNAPKILYPSTENGDSSIFEMVPFASLQGSLITKVVAVDADSGHNSWLSYHFIQISEPFPFSINQQTGEIKTTRVFQEKDVLKHKVLIMVKDNGDPVLSATASLSLVVADYIQQVVPQLSNTLSDDNTPFQLQMYLMIALALISLLFILTIILVIISKCRDSKPSPVLGLQSTNLYSQVDPGMLSRINNGTLPLPYSYNVCVSLDQSESDFTFIKPKQNVPVDNLIDADDSGLGNEGIKDALTPAPAWQLQYSIVKELRKDSVIANIANDLGLDIKQLSFRRLRIVSDVSEKYFSVNSENGNLYVKDRIDRETLLVANPLNVFTVKIEIQDIDDNPPVFFNDIVTLKMIELTLPGKQFVLQTAEDPDIGTNSVETYQLSDNQYFTLNEKASSDGSKFPELVLEKSLDRESKNIHELFITASDGGTPVRTGTALIRVIVIDANDNLPVFTQEVYKVSISENTPINSTVLRVNASDMDEGTNAQITYSFSKTSKNNLHTNMFSINSSNGEIKTKNILNYEAKKEYDISVQGKDGGGFVAHSKVLIEITDENDNTPELSITPIFSPIPENTTPGTVTALIKVHDQDSGENGDVDCQILGSVPFQLVYILQQILPNYYHRSLGQRESFMV
ncbi:hypothetical protein XELAEV_18021592mg [Xenopus laevis]|uniref:Cadherin domain-containing protein n=1 Tax=Xenopus laevis TaxID=8355 RepID=A0A974HRU0_XENLA|nr:hypothetical protein XELAEV_18021592mg [Xenopus laevis]